MTTTTLNSITTFICKLFMLKVFAITFNKILNLLKTKASNKADNYSIKFCSNNIVYR